MNFIHASEYTKSFLTTLVVCILRIDASQSIKEEAKLVQVERFVIENLREVTGG
jgi:hypothetical protein